MLGSVLIYAVVMWYASAGHWFKSAIKNPKVVEESSRFSADRKSFDL